MSSETTNVGLINPTVLRKAKIVYNSGLSECNSVNIASQYLDHTQTYWYSQTCLNMHQEISFAQNK